jgi:hypothetical protein
MMMISKSKTSIWTKNLHEVVELLSGLVLDERFGGKSLVHGLARITGNCNVPAFFLETYYVLYQRNQRPFSTSLYLHVFCIEL